MRKWWQHGKWSIELETSKNRKYKFCSAQVRLNGVEGDRGIVLHWSFPYLFAIWLSVSHPRINKYLPTKDVKATWRNNEIIQLPVEKTIGFSISDGYIRLSLWETEGEWSRDEPWWWQFMIHPKNIILGRPKHRKENELQYESSLALAEGNYHIEVAEYDSVWKRPRWPFEKRVHRFNLVYTPPLPVPGKGENDYDLDDDAIYESTIAAATLNEAVERQISRVTRDRKRYGGADWQPA